MSKKGDLLGEALFGGSRFVRWSLSPFLLVFAVTMPALLQSRTANAITILVFLEFMCAALLAGFWLPAKYGHWAFRAVAGSVFVLYFGYFVYEWFFSGHPLKLIEPLGQASPRNALLGLLVFGLSGLRYALFGRFGFRQQSSVAS